MSFFRRSGSALCHLAGYVVLAAYHWHEPTLLGYVLLLAGIALSALWHKRE